MIDSVGLDTVLLKTASRCNYDCNYCYVYHSSDTRWVKQPKRMTEELLDVIQGRLVEQASAQERGFAIVLHGGEPLLLGLDRMSQFIAALRTNLPATRYPISIQTNGSLLSNEFLDLFAETHTSVSVSIDGPCDVNDMGRLNHRGVSTFQETIEGIERLVSHRASDFLFAGTLSVVQPSSDPKSVYRFLKNLRTPSMNFLLQDGNYDNLPLGKSCFESTEYGTWLARLFDLYVEDSLPVPIRVFDDYIKLSLGGGGVKEGSGKERFGILIIETDGEIRKNDTLRSSFEGADVFTDAPRNVKHTSILQVLQSSEFESYSDLQEPTAEKCINCDLLSVCGGGMPLYRWSRERGYRNPSIYCRDHELLIRHIQRWLADQRIPTDLKVA